MEKRSTCAKYWLICEHRTQISQCAHRLFISIFLLFLSHLEKTMFKGSIFESKLLLRIAHGLWLLSSIQFWEFYPGKCMSYRLEGVVLFLLEPRIWCICHFDISLKNNLIKRLCLGVQQSGIKGFSEQSMLWFSGETESVLATAVRARRKMIHEMQWWVLVWIS